MNATFLDDSVGEKISFLFEEMEGASRVSTSEIARTLNLNIGTQEDAQEFLLRLLNEIDESNCNENEDEKISNIFKGYTEQNIVCKNIKFSKKRQQRFLDLTIGRYNCKYICVFIVLYDTHE
jgi:hypothetical protein